MKKVFFAFLFCLFSLFSYARVNDAQRYFLSGRAAYSDRAYTIAIRLFNRVLRLEPFGEYADDAAYYRILSYYEDGRYQRAIQLCNQFLSFYPNSPHREHVSYILVEVQFHLRNWDRVIQQATIFLREYPRGEYADDVHFLLGSTYLIQGKYGSAVEELRIVVNTTNSPLQEKAAYRLAVAHYFDDNYRKTREKATAFINTHTNSALLPHVRMLLGRVAFAEKRYPEARSIFLDVLSNAPPASVVAAGIYYRALVDIQMRNFSSAINYLSVLVQHEHFGNIPNEYREEGLYKLSLLYKLHRRYRESHSTLTELLQLTRDKDLRLKATLELASVSVLLSNFTAAKEAYESLATIDSAYVTLAKQKLGELAFLMTNYSEAERIFSDIITTHRDSPQFPDALYWRARSRVEQGNHAAAVEDFGLFRKLFPTAARIDEIIMFTGNSHAAMRQWDEALLSYNFLLRNYPNSRLADSAHLAIAWVYIQRGLIPRAEETYRGMIAAYPNSPRAAIALFSLAAIQYNQRRFPEALTNFERVYRQHRTSFYAGEALIKIGWIRMRQEQFRTLIRFFENADTTHLNPNQRATFYNLLGWAYFRENDFERAITNYRLSSTVAVSTNTILENQLYIAKAYYNMGQFDNAISTYEAYIRLALQANILQDVPVAYLGMMWSYLKKGEMLTVESIYQKLLTEFPQSPSTFQAIFRMGEIAFSSRRFNEAIEHYERLLRSPPSEYQAAAYYWLGQTYLRLGRRLEAIRMFEAYIEKYPQGDYLPAALFQLGNLYFALNNFERARNAYNTLIGRFPRSVDADMARVQLRELQMVQEARGDPERLYRIMIRESRTPEARSLALSKLANFYKENNRNRQAIETYREIEAIGLLPDAAQAALHTARILQGDGLYAQAIQAYSRILTRYGEEKFFPEAIYGIGFSYFSNQQWRFARRYLEQVMEKYPESPQATQAQALLRRIPQGE